jgi:aspartyl-tRNA(Asn)/glutamyl-tRNA(Gln) amidotransferase subunit C
MAVIDTTLCRTLADLARLRLDPTDVAAFSAQLEQVVSWMAQLQEVDVAGVPEYLPEGGGPLREDVPSTPLPTEVALGGAPARDGDYFAVPKFKED